MRCGFKLSRKFIYVIFALAVLITGCNGGGTTSSAAPVVYSNLIIESNDGVQPVLDLINGAQSSIYVTMYEIQDAAIESALVNAANSGVSVKIIYSNGTAYIDSESAFCNANPLISCIQSSNYFYVTHEKTMLIDNSIAVIMSFNWVDNANTNYFGTTRDFGIVTNNPFDVQSLASEFSTDWANAVNQTGNFPNVNLNSRLFFSPSTIYNYFDSYNILFNNVILTATKTLDIYSEEFGSACYSNTCVNFVQILNSLAAQGVKIRIISAECDVSGLESGIQVITGPESYPLYFHAKSAIVDGVTATVMSVNYTDTSIFSNREAGIVSNDQNVSAIESTFNSDWQNLNQFITTNNLESTNLGCYGTP